MARPKGRPNPPSIGRHWGARIAERRVALGMTQQQFADALGVNVRTLQGWESGRRTSQYTAMIEREIARLESNPPLVEKVGTGPVHKPDDRRKRLRAPAA